MTKASNLTLLVNTSDSFEDCWQRFFDLLTRYWPGCYVPILLSTESKDPGGPVASRRQKDRNHDPRHSCSLRLLRWWRRIREYV